MRVPDIRIGETYQVKVPQRLPPALRRPPQTEREFIAYMRLPRHCGHRFELTVTDLDAENATVDGYETATTNRTTVPLTPEQAEALGLPTGSAYEIDGFVTDTDGNEATFTVTVAYTSLPAIWLRPLAEPVPIAPSSARFYRARIRKKATGLSADDVDRAADEAQEHERELAGQALDSYQAEEWLRTAEVEHHEWRRISSLMTETGMVTYDPSKDPQGAETDP
ncbi:hypothetical protein [Streptantibioticus ferralitis]|uniref:Uncharacterized protein n=1 Tax=Streptantibioticus ferralitis TaxID=236510 RepID=A0ABT5Z7R3_9ACTN|nr:hypothetical protein [Streptantibioticus ferralitis]MDF2259768.1 hypothetical protein [Streptantibioticus ferralitis]